MKYKLYEYAGGSARLDEFASRHGLEMEVRERPSGLVSDLRLSRYYAGFAHAEVSTGGMLSCLCGNGDTPEAAISAYLQEIQGQRLVIDVTKPTQREIDVPNEITV